MINNIIGSARTLRTAVMVCEYLKKRFPAIPEGTIKYRFTNSTSDNGWWSADIIVETFKNDLDFKLSGEMVEVCRAFVAGAGEIWA